VIAGQLSVVEENSGSAELLRHQFHYGEPARPMRHSARDALRRALGDDHDEDCIDDVLIVISELVQNVGQHTHSHGELIVTIEADTVLVEVGDTSTTVPHVCRTDANRSGGRGLQVIDTICQQWGVRTCHRGKVVWARLPRHASPADTARPDRNLSHPGG
jgi:anti-sigma regulatory factor (Ser/Thr protein kinase)